MFTPNITTTRYTLWIPQIGHYVKDPGNQKEGWQPQDYNEFSDRWGDQASSRDEEGARANEKDIEENLKQCDALLKNLIFIFQCIEKVLNVRTARRQKRELLSF